MKLKFSCVVDQKAIFKAQTFILINSLLELGNVAPQDVYVHTLEENLEDNFYDWLKGKNVNVIKIQAFHTANKYCNKLAQLDTFTSGNLPFDYVFFLDCDIAVASLIDLDLKDDVYAKIVDFPCPPSKILQKIYNASGTTYTPIKTSFSLKGDDTTDVNNCNGGVYIISNTFLQELAPKWKEQAQWCIENSTLFTEAYTKHADQVGFAMAISQLGKKVNHLPIAWNFPTHVDGSLLPNISPKIVHFHDVIDEHLRIKKIGQSEVDKELDRINQITFDQLSKEFDNGLFWNLRYALFPELGSGVGSRGEVLEYKKQLVKNITYPFQTLEIIDVGCGDLELMKDMHFNKYTGLDVSDESLKIGKSKRPDWNFVHGSIASDEIKEADLVMCFDVLIHQGSQKDFEDTVKGIVDKARKRVIIGAYNNTPEFSSHITYYYNSIQEEISKYGKFNEIAIVGSYRDITVISATKRVNDHKRDITSEKLTKGFAEVSRPDLLQYLVDISRHNFGFYTTHYPRVFEYTWLLEQLEHVKEASVLDIGAGVCPLPLALTDYGMKVTTVDYHPTVRKKETLNEWNEWGFLDYAMFDPSITSHNQNFSEFTSSSKFDFMYSISVIEHMPKEIRRQVLKKAKDLLKIGGKLLLTIDLVPNTNNLWNLSEAKEVEPIKVHGTISTLKKELKKLGFAIESESTQRNIKDAVTDVYYIKAVSVNKSAISKLFDRFG